MHIDPGLKFHAGVAWLDLLVTIGQAYGPAPVERLRGVPQLVEWLEHEGLTPVVPPAESDVIDARALREALRPVVLATLDDRAVTAGELAVLAPWPAAAAPPRPVLRVGRLALDPPQTTLAALAGLATQAIPLPRRPRPGPPRRLRRPVVPHGISRLDGSSALVLARHLRGARPRA